MSHPNKHTPERFPTESQVDYRARRRASKHAVKLRDPVTGRPIDNPPRYGSNPGAQMANIRAARKARNVRRHRARAK